MTRKVLLVGIFLAAAVALCPAANKHKQPPLQRALYTDKNDIRDTPVPHPLSWWTVNPLRLDASSDLMLGFSPGGHTITEADFDVEKKIRHFGPLAGHDIVEIDLRISSKGGGGAEKDASWWKTLLVEVSKDRYLEIFGLQADAIATWDGVKQWKTAVSGKGADSVLWTNNPDGGNGAGCWEGYWWFDKSGAHEVDFKPLYDAIRTKIPKDATYPAGCLFLDIPAGTLQGYVQKKDAACHACDYLGGFKAEFVIHKGRAEPTSVRYTPEPDLE